MRRSTDSTATRGGLGDAGSLAISRGSLLTIAPLAYGMGALLESTATATLFGGSMVTFLWGCMVALVCALVSLGLSAATGSDSALSRRLAARLSVPISRNSASTLLVPVFLVGVFSGLA
jgi:hypothetical protein